MPDPVYEDFLTNVQDAFIAMFMDDDILSAYNWERWDSDKEVTRPRGTIDMSADSEGRYMAAAIVRPEITLEGKPKKQKLTAAYYQLQRAITSSNLSTLLNARTNKVKFFDGAESIQMRQTIEGDIRKRTILFSIAAVSLV